MHRTQIPKMPQQVYPDDGIRCIPYEEKEQKNINGKRKHQEHRLRGLWWKALLIKHRFWLLSYGQMRVLFVVIVQVIKRIAKKRFQIVMKHAPSTFIWSLTERQGPRQKNLITLTEKQYPEINRKWTLTELQ